MHSLFWQVCSVHLIPFHAKSLNPYVHVTFQFFLSILEHFLDSGFGLSLWGTECSLMKGIIFKILTWGSAIRNSKKKKKEGVNTFCINSKDRTLSMFWISSWSGDGSLMIQYSCGEHDATHPTRRQASSSASTVLPVLEWTDVTRRLCLAECQLCNSGSLCCCVMNHGCLMIYLNGWCLKANDVPLVTWRVLYFAVNGLLHKLCGCPCEFSLCMWVSSEPHPLLLCAFERVGKCAGALFVPPPSLLFAIFCEKSVFMFIFICYFFISTLVTAEVLIKPF